MFFRKCFIIVLICFYLGIQDGYLALWKEGNNQPVETFPFRSAMLPDTDQKALAKGIRIEDAEHLARLMEDYLS